MQTISVASASFKMATTFSRAAPAPAVSAAAAAAAARLGTRFVDGESSPAELLAREGRDGALGLVVVRELDEAEPLGSARLAVGDHGHGLDIAVLGEQIAKIV